MAKDDGDIVNGYDDDIYNQDADFKDNNRDDFGDKTEKVFTRTKVRSVWPESGRSTGLHSCGYISLWTRFPPNKFGCGRELRGLTVTGGA